MSWEYLKRKWDGIIERELNIGDLFEFHVVTNSEYENWYKKFIDNTRNFSELIPLQSRENLSKVSINR